LTATATPTVAYRPSNGFAMFIGVGAVVAFMLVAIFGTTGHSDVVVAVVLVMSPIMMAVINFFEDGYLSNLFNPASQSWAFMFGDALGLTWALSWFASAWPSLPQGWFGGLDWALLCAVIGGLAGFGFHGLDRVNYKKEDATAQLNTRSKWWHDFGIYTALFGGTILLTWPLLWADAQGVLPDAAEGQFYWGCAGLGLWVACAVADATFHKLDPKKLHPPGKFWPAA